ncbi:GNAT family N-acetyltransferase [Pseudodesulfovibrio sediminis]|uniref:N-acetyltransferase n=1 Tax=Pseudodesulfovibrio sediminis TaxID=2810563 RepID=A0ABM7P3G4_9BACT|nr:GNAT family N-acetyltransferase [Pseudodesulfovibrio sediminis]BCS88191.1 N-acetyltransferase [Pseudodesulfovibrio sediminis]
MTHDITIRLDCDGVDWTKAAEIFERAPLGTREPNQLARTFANSDLVCFAWDDETLVGLGRALSDGEKQSVVYDLCILPEYQGQKIGSIMMEVILETLTTPNVVLWAVPGKEPFYARFGFNPMRTAMALFENPDSSAEKGYIDI